MKRLHHLVGLAWLMVAAPVAAQSVGVTGPRATASVNVMKPLQLTAERNLQFGTVLVGTYTGTQTVTVSASGRTCGTGAGLTCSGVYSTAQFKVTGSNRQVVLISSATPTVTLTNPTGQTLALTPSMPASVTLPNSGNQGITFDVGGSLALPSTVTDGLYSGTIDIQVIYQ